MNHPGAAFLVFVAGCLAGMLVADVDVVLLASPLLGGAARLVISGSASGGAAVGAAVGLSGKIGRAHV